jgi:hypothetical protein
MAACTAVVAVAVHRRWVLAEALQLVAMAAAAPRLLSRARRSRVLAVVAVRLSGAAAQRVLAALAVAAQVLLQLLRVLRVQPIQVAVAVAVLITEVYSPVALVALVWSLFPCLLHATQVLQQGHLRSRQAGLTQFFNLTRQEVIQHEPFCKSY